MQLGHQQLEHEQRIFDHEVQSELVGKVYSKEELERVIAYRDEYRAKRAKAANPTP